MTQDGPVTDFEGNEITLGAEIVFLQHGGRLARGVVLQSRIAGMDNIMLIQSLRDLTKTCLAMPTHSVVVVVKSAVVQEGKDEHASGNH